MYVLRVGERRLQHARASVHVFINSWFRSPVLVVVVVVCVCVKKAPQVSVGVFYIPVGCSI